MLREAVESVNAQTLPGVEVIVVSSYGSLSARVLADFTKCGIKCIEVPENWVVAAKRNAGISAAQGEFVAFLDDDDILYPEHLASLHALAVQSGAKIVYSNAFEGYQEYLGGHWTVLRRRKVYAQGFRRDALLVRNYLPILSVLLRHEVLASDRFDPEFEVLEDWELWLRLSAHHDFCHLNEWTCEYRVRESQDRLSIGRRDAFLPAMRRLFQKHRNRVAARPLLRLQQQLALAALRWQESRGAWASSALRGTNN